MALEATELCGKDYTIRMVELSRQEAAQIISLLAQQLADTQYSACPAIRVRDEHSNVKYELALSVGPSLTKSSKKVHPI